MLDQFYASALIENRSAQQTYQKARANVAWAPQTQTDPTGRRKLRHYWSA